tara:strand:+ start:315 stop:611 length:297 start_codon:yes stop_codon:yes gene_type:complete
MSENETQKQEITQELVNQTFIEMSELWLDKFEASGHTLVSSFIAENKDGWAVQFLAEYQMAKEYVEALGLSMPVLVEGVTVKLTENEEGDEDANQATH